MKWISNIKAQFIPGVLQSGKVLGRPNPVTEKTNVTIEDMENDGWIGVYDPSVMMDLNKNGSIHISFGLVPFDSMDTPESTLDDRIKEVQKAKPSKYRARWTGTKYTYEPIDNGS